jgi:hypothetical protein
LIGSGPQALEHGEFLDAACGKLFELVEDARLESLEDHPVRTLNLPVGAWVYDQCLVDPDPVSISKLQELLAYEVGPVVYDDDVGHTEPVDNVKKELDGLLGVSFGNGFHLDPLGELVHHDKQVSETTRGLLERPDHIETPDHERLGEGMV